MQNILNIQNLISSKPHLAEIPYLGDICTNAMQDLPENEYFSELSPVFHLNVKKSYLDKLQGYVYACYDFSIISKLEFDECMKQIQDVGNPLLKKIYSI